MEWEGSVDSVPTHFHPCFLCESNDKHSEALINNMDHLFKLSFAEIPFKQRRQVRRYLHLALGTQ